MPANTSKVPAGTLLEGKFRILREIGRGGMAAVYEAEHIEIGKRVAVKILAAELVNSRVVLGRFLREARATAAIRSPYICDVHDSGEWDGRPFLVMELLQGESLYELLSRERRLSFELTLRIAKQTARGLQKAHDASVVHRDLKPENIYITRNEDGEVVAKILDFGLAKFYEPALEGGESTRLTREGALFGTPAYMAPEQAKGQGEVDERCDLWALACIIYECLTGRTVWNADQGVAMILAQIAGAPIPRPTRLREDLPSTFDDWFLKALERDPDARYQTSKELAEALEVALLPPPGTVKSAPLHSREEGEVVDALISAEHEAPDEPSQPKATPIPSSGGEAPPSSNQSPGPGIDIPIDVEPPASGGGAKKAIVALVFAAALGLGGYYLWLYVLNPPVVTAPPVATQTKSVAASAPPPPSSLEPLETAPHAQQIASAQTQLAAGDRKAALATFKEAFNNGGTSVARGILNQAAAVLPEEPGKCAVTGLARPRPFDVKAKPLRPSLVVTKTGPLYVWIDNHKDPRRHEGFATLLDNSLRRLTPARSVTPEAEGARHPQLVPAGDKLALLYWDRRGSDPGVYARLLETDGRIAGPARRLSSDTAKEYSPALARHESGEYWAVWQEEKDGRGDLFARRLDKELKLTSEPVRLTLVNKGMEAHGPSLAIAQNQLRLTYQLVSEHSKDSLVVSQAIKLDDPQLEAGLHAPDSGAEDDDAGGEDAGLDGLPVQAHVGSLNLVSKTEGRFVEPQIACSNDGCFIVFDDDRGGGYAAFLSHEKNEPIWRREFERRANRPAVGAATESALVAWYDIPARKLSVARISRDGLEEASLVGRVGAFQSQPVVTSGSKPGEWYVAWRDFEAGKLEGYLVRVECQ